MDTKKIVMFLNSPVFLKRSMLSLILLAVLFPVTRLVSPAAIIDDEHIFLAWLPMGAILAVTLLFGWAAILPVFLSSLFSCYMFVGLDGLQSSAIALSLTLPVGLTSALMYSRKGRRWRYGILSRGLGQRLFWLCFFTPCCTKICMLIMGYLIPFPDAMAGYLGKGTMLVGITDILSLIASALIFTPLFYYPLRMLISPVFARSFWQMSIARNFRKEVRIYTVCWCLFLICFLLLFCIHSKTIFISSYLIPFLFIFFTHGIQRLTREFVSLMWVATSWALLSWNQGFLYGVQGDDALSFVLSAFISFTVCMLYMMQVYHRNERLRRVYLSLALTDPLTQLPNMRAMEQHIATWKQGALCCLRMNNLDFLSRHYGMMMRVHCKRVATRTMAPYLQEGELIFQLPGNELLMFLRGGDIEGRLSAKMALLNNRKIPWNNTLLDVEYSASWGAVSRPGPDELQRLLGQLSYLSELASTSGGVVGLDSQLEVVEGQTSAMVRMLRIVRETIEQDKLELYIQPIVNRKGAGYNEILTRIHYDGDIITPGEFMPVVAEFNLSVRFDMQVISRLVSWLSQYDRGGSDALFSVNLMPLTLMTKDVAANIVALFRRTGVPVSRVIIEVTEAQAFSDDDIPLENIRYLRRSGFRIAIDDFGTGYANYARLKNLEADIIKIDGSFIRDICVSNVDYLIVNSICQLAKARGLTVVAEFVESEEQRNLLLAMRVDYLQGYLLGKPRPLNSLC
ncbi:putative diguanylate cyclase [Shimwellia blattae DSM 4481 = NBRC 105725]|uniref:Putative diguanylate cyclase n=2 Tax=Shimwellia blattae TaxID=563 RepID=I2B6S0_SHIBC|nr:EAL domain-containing protein [Shimwellia blattae]AFJ46224.1 putative diguanylate cyclase [Shimwellia blattae DSM 4481 = NBRC 105725]